MAQPTCSFFKLTGRFTQQNWTLSVSGSSVDSGFAWAGPGTPLHANGLTFSAQSGLPMASRTSTPSPPQFANQSPINNNNNNQISPNCSNVQTNQGQTSSTSSPNSPLSSDNGIEMEDS